MNRTHQNGSLSTKKTWATSPSSYNSTVTGPRESTAAIEAGYDLFCDEHDTSINITF